MKAYKRLLNVASFFENFLLINVFIFITATGLVVLGIIDKSPFVLMPFFAAALAFVMYLISRSAASIFKNILD